MKFPCSDNSVFPPVSTAFPHSDYVVCLYKAVCIPIFPIVLLVQLESCSFWCIFSKNDILTQIRSFVGFVQFLVLCFFSSLSFPSMYCVVLSSCCVSLRPCIGWYLDHGCESGSNLMLFACITIITCRLVLDIRAHMHTGSDVTHGLHILFFIPNVPPL